MKEEEEEVEVEEEKKREKQKEKKDRRRRIRELLTKRLRELAGMWIDPSLKILMSHMNLH